MKSFGIESKFIADDAEHVTEYRRFVTPWFYINLKTKAYEHLKTQYVSAWFLCFRVNGWFYGEKYLSKGFNEKTDRLLIELDNAASQFKQTNVVRFKR